MEPSFVTPYLVIIAVVLGVSIFMMRFMPRMMAGVPFVEPKAVHDLMEGGKELVIIDVRTAEEFTSPLGHVPGSINMVGL
ncbi:MAG: rhodanese-like domain-containing protein, partial [Rhodospirillales bacterium]|nr:rhodanese-like domain-containing protein [Rhodospirillales bacterium]